MSAIFSWSVQCHEILSDFLEFNYENQRIHLTKTCMDDLNSIRSGIEKNQIWALKGKSVSCARADQKKLLN